MPRYTRAWIPGGSFFFTVALLERRRALLTEHITTLRAAFKEVRRHRPFEIDAIVIPVKHGHVAQVRDWPYSSFHRYVAEGVYPIDWAGTAELAGDDRE